MEQPKELCPAARKGVAAAVHHSVVAAAAAALPQSARPPRTRSWMRAPPHVQESARNVEG